MKNKDEFIIPLALFTELFGNSMDEIVKSIDNIQKEAECFQKRYDEKKSEMTHRSRTFNRDEHRGHSCDVSYNNSTGTSYSHGKKTNTDKLFTKDNAYFVEMLNRQRQENEKRKRHEMEQHKKVVDSFVNEVISKLEENVLRGKDYVEVKYRSADADADTVIIKDVVKRLKDMNFEVRLQEKSVFVKIRL